MAGASVNTIAAAAGLKSGSVFFHFASKDELVDAMLRDGLRLSLVHLEQAVDGVTGPHARLRAAIAAHSAVVHDLPHYTTAVLDRAVTGGPEFRRLRGRYVRHWTTLIADAQRAGVLGDGPDPRLLRDLLFGALNAVGLTGRPPAETTEALETLLCLRAMTP